MTAYLNRITHNNIIFKGTVVPDVNTDHQKIIVADFRCFPTAGAQMDCHMLTKVVSVTYHQSPDLRLRAKAKYLWPATNHAIGKKVIVFPNLDIFANHYISVNDCAGAN